MADPVFKKDSVYQEFNLREILGRSPDEETKAAFSQAVLDHIKDRTAKGAGIGGEPFNFGKYSDEYADSLEFKVHGKDQHEVNMELTGDMMGTLDVIQSSRDKVRIGWSDKTQNAKAYNHNTGDTVPRRPFFGVTKSELKEIAKQFRSENLKERTPERDAFTEKALDFMAELERSQIGDDDE